MLISDMSTTRGSKIRGLSSKLVDTLDVVGVSGSLAAAKFVRLAIFLPLSLFAMVANIVSVPPNKLLIDKYTHRSYLMKALLIPCPNMYRVAQSSAVP